MAVACHQFGDLLRRLGRYRHGLFSGNAKHAVLSFPDMLNLWKTRRDLKGWEQVEQRNGGLRRPLAVRG